jgi:hypothetical protein
MDSIPSGTELSATTTTSIYYSADVITFAAIVTSTDSATDIDYNEGNSTSTIYNMSVAITTDNASYTTTGGLDGPFRAAIGIFISADPPTLATQERLQLQHSQRERRLGVCLHCRGLIAQRKIIERDIEERATNVVFPSVIFQPDAPAVSNDEAEAEHVFWQVASGPNVVDYPCPKGRCDFLLTGADTPPDNLFTDTPPVSPRWTPSTTPTSTPWTPPTGPHQNTPQPMLSLQLAAAPNPDHSSTTSLSSESDSGSSDFDFNFPMCSSTSTSFCIHLIRDRLRRITLRRRLWEGSYGVRRGCGVRDVF